METQIIEDQVFSEDLVAAVTRARDKAASAFGVSPDDVVLIVLGGCTAKDGEHGWRVQARVDPTPRPRGSHERAPARPP